MYHCIYLYLFIVISAKFAYIFRIRINSGIGPLQKGLLDPRLTALHGHPSME